MRSIQAHGQAVWNKDQSRAKARLQWTAQVSPMAEELLHARTRGCLHVVSVWIAHVCELRSSLPSWGGSLEGGQEQVVLGFLRKGLQLSWKGFGDTSVFLPSPQDLPLWGSGHTRRAFLIFIALAVFPGSTPGAPGQGQLHQDQGVSLRHMQLFPA